MTEARGQSVGTGHSVCLGRWQERGRGEDGEFQMGSSAGEGAGLEGWEAGGTREEDGRARSSSV